MMTFGTATSVDYPVNTCRKDHYINTLRQITSMLARSLHRYFRVPERRVSGW
jgi:hypothetical protein